MECEFLSIFVSLNHWQQPRLPPRVLPGSCELLSISYLWTTDNNSVNLSKSFFMLWIAFNFVSLNHWQQLTGIINAHRISCELLSISYLWTTDNNYKFSLKFVSGLWIAFNFVSLNHWQQHYPRWNTHPRVVNCFQFRIFEPLTTTSCGIFLGGARLWIAFNFVSLNHWQQLITTALQLLTGCELLSISYLWTTDNNKKTQRRR